MGERAIHAEGLTKYFGDVIGVEELSFEVGRGEIYGFLGANGAGKTTTMRICLGILQADAGVVRWPLDLVEDGGEMLMGDVAFDE